MLAIAYYTLYTIDDFGDWFFSELPIGRFLKDLSFLHLFCCPSGSKINAWVLEFRQESDGRHY